MPTTVDVQKFWDARPCNVRHSSAAIGSYEYSKDVTRRKYFVEPHIPAFAQFYRWDNKKVLEIGCGIGTDTLEFARAGADVDAMDLSAKSLDIAQARLVNEFPLRGNLRGSAHFIHADAELYLPIKFYDLIYAFGVLHHASNPDVILKRAKNRLAPDGELRIMLYAKWSIKNIFGQQPEAQANCPIARTYSMEQAQEFLEENGFEVVSIEKTHIFPYRVDLYKQYIYEEHWYYRFLPRRIFQWLQHRLGWHLLIVARPRP